jgi:hypothetical protein
VRLLRGIKKLLRYSVAKFESNTPQHRFTNNILYGILFLVRMFHGGTAMVEIVIRRQEKGYRAFLKKEPLTWCDGDSVHAAIGALVSFYRNQFDVSIEMEGRSTENPTRG